MTEDDFLINYRGKKVKVSSVNDAGNIYFIIHLNPQIIIAERMVEDSWLWLEAGKGETGLSKELGEIIELTDI